MAGFVRLVGLLGAMLRGTSGGERPSGPDGELRDDAEGNDSAPPTSLAAIVEEMLIASGLNRHHQEQDEVSGTQKLQNLEELVNAASLYPPSFDGLAEFLEAIELDSSREENSDEVARVVLITMHNTKGLEFDRVIITGLEEGLFPRDGDPEDLEEERRLFYVAITRARNELTLTSCRYRRLHGKRSDFLPSRFLTEIPKELVHVDAGEYASGGPNNAIGTLDGLRRGRSGGEEHPWPRGTAIFHDDYGSGLVVKAWYSGSEPVVLVRFETGATAQFLPKYTPLERIAGDDGVDIW